ERRKVGIIPEFGTEQEMIDVPAAAEAGEAFTVTITTTWHNGCARVGDTRVEAQGSTVTITPFDIINEREGIMCTAAVQTFTHAATVTFSEPGVGRVVVHGRAADEDVVRTSEHEVVVN